MKYHILILSVICFFGYTAPLFSQGDTEYDKAAEYLAKKGEVYFRFSIDSRDELDNLTREISIDNIVDKTVYAYANRKEFEAFVKKGLYYEVLRHPGERIENPRMSDYSDPHNRQWDEYPTYEGYCSLMEKFAEDYPQLCTLITIGESVKDRKLLVAKISDNAGADEKEPQFFSTATIHGDETLGFMLMLRMMDYLLANYGTDARVTRIVDSIELYISPLSNPDGTYQNDNSTLQGAGRANANGTDLNRNYPDPVFGLNQAAWEKETKAFIAFEEKQRFVMSMDLHGGVEVVCYPWGCKWDNIIADDDWYVFVSQEYADIAKENSPDGYLDFNDAGIVNGVDWYAIEGGRMSYLPYFRGCRVITLELSSEKLLSESKLNDHWDYNREALLTYIEQVLHGIRGTVTDTMTGVPLSAKVFIAGHDKDSSHVYSDSVHGAYYRPIFAGTYDMTFSNEEFISKTVSGVEVKNNAATVLDVQLTPKLMQNEYTAKIGPADFEIRSHARGITVSWNNNYPGVTIAIYNVKGKMVKNVTPPAGSGVNSVTWNGLNSRQRWCGAGCYIVRIQTAEGVYAKRLIFSR